jgi:hypothetical protein
MATIGQIADAVRSAAVGSLQRTGCRSSECAQRMSITEAGVWDLIERHALRAYRWAGWGDVAVQPAIVTGVVPRSAERKKQRRLPARR